MIKFELQNIYENYESNITFSIESAGFSVECKARHLHKDIFEHMFPESFHRNSVIYGFSYDAVNLAIKFNYDFRLVYPLTLEESLQIFKFMKIYGRKGIILHKDIFEHMFPESFHRNPVIYGFSYDAVNLAIKFNYDFRLVYPLTLEESLQIFKFMKIYGRKGIIYEFERFLIEQINESTVSRISQSAVECNDTKVKNYCFEFLMNCLRESIPISDFELIPKKMALELLEMSFTKVSYKY
uniref:BTB domain-containing protein n=1 Tax=Panagrolaimus sp. ES5 TaxID=591445 RepID=A0AC34F335_9BILA